MPLISQRSFPDWARKLADDHGEPLKDIWAEIVLAVIREELSATSLMTPPWGLTETVKLIIYRRRSDREWLMWRPELLLPAIKEMIDDDAAFADLDKELKPVLIADADMARWLRSRSGEYVIPEGGVVNHVGPTPVPAPAEPAPTLTRNEAVSITIDTHGKPGRRGRLKHKAFAKKVREVASAPASAPGFSDDAIAQAVRRRNRTKPDNVRNLSEFVRNLK